MDKVVLSRTPLWVVDDCLPMIRNNYIEETYFNYSYSPLFVGRSATGFLTVVLESTNRVIAERQLRYRSSRPGISCVMFVCRVSILMASFQSARSTISPRVASRPTRLQTPCGS
jgi:hypothetical protein